MNPLKAYCHTSNTTVKLLSRNFHSTALVSARRPFTPGKIINRWGTYKRLAPSSLANVDVRQMPHRPVPSHILRPPYAETGISSNWEPEIPILSQQDIHGMREAGKLAKEILTLGSTLCKVECN